MNKGTEARLSGNQGHVRGVEGSKVGEVGLVLKFKKT